MKLTGSKVTAEALKKLMLIGDKQGTISLKDLSQEMGLSTDETLVFLSQIFPNGNGAEIYTENNICMVNINANSLQYMLPLSPSEWLALHELLEHQADPALNSLKRNITENGPIKAMMELLSHLDHTEHTITKEHQKFINLLDVAIDAKSVVTIKTVAGKKYSVFPTKIIHLEGQLSLIAEDVHDHCLLVMHIDEIKSVTPQETTHKAKVSAFEIEEFITAIRSMSEKETRLILKIHDPQSVNLFPDYHFLGKPCMITNPNGDLIWAAYVEPCADLFDWLLGLGGNVEVLDPGKFRDEFLAYCEEKLRKVA